MENRRTHTFPFAVADSVITDAAGNAIAIAETPEIARFIVLACDRYDLFMALFDLCRGEIEGITLPYRIPSHKAFADLAQQLHDDISRNGR